MNVSTNGVFFVPVLRFIAPNIFRWNQYVKSVDKMMELIRESIKNHQETFNSTELRYFLKTSPLIEKYVLLNSYSIF